VDKRASLRQQIIQERGSIYQIFSECLQKVGCEKLISLFDEKQKVQQMKTKTGTRDGKIINKNDFTQIMQRFSQ
jgi:hypothetical protein